MRWCWRAAWRLAPVLLARRRRRECGRSAPAACGQKPAPAPPQSEANPFPEDTSNVPVLPSKNEPVPREGTYGGADNGTDARRFPLPGEDLDPVRSPDDAAPAAASGADQDSSSSLTGLDRAAAKAGRRSDRKEERERYGDSSPSTRRLQPKTSMWESTTWTTRTGRRRCRASSRPWCWIRRIRRSIGGWRSASAIWAIMLSARANYQKVARIRSGEPARQGCDQGAEGAGDCECARSPRMDGQRQGLQVEHAFFKAIKSPAQRR